MNMDWYVGKIKNTKVTYISNFLIFLLLTIGIIICKFTKCNLYFELVFLFWVSDAVVILFLVLFAFTNSFIIKGDKIVLFDSFRKSSYNIGEIDSIVITNNMNAGRGRYTIRIKNNRKKTVSCPIICIIKGDACLGGATLDHPMTNWDIDKIIKNNNVDAELIFGCLSNKKIIKSFQKYFNGKIYIARTVFENFKEEISAVYSNWEYDEKSINIIRDQNSKGNWCNSPYLKI